jgi:hypothetical protein
VEELFPPLIEGSLSHTSTTRVLNHLKSCRHCEQNLAELRAFFLTDVDTTDLEPSSAPVSVAEPRPSPFWSQWQDRLERWLDVVFPGTVPAPAWRNAVATALPTWEFAARQQSRQPLFTSQQGDVHVTLHVARGLIFGWITNTDGEPLYPMLLTLSSPHAQDAVLSQTDGTFQLRWDPEATVLECQSPLGAITRFPIPLDE